jgi:hypothetical protein
MHVFDITTIRVASELDWYILQFKATINYARPIFNSFLAAWLSQWIVNRTDQGMRKNTRLEQTTYLSRLNHPKFCLRHWRLQPATCPVSANDCPILATGLLNFWVLTVDCHRSRDVQFYYTPFLSYEVPDWVADNHTDRNAQNLASQESHLEFIWKPHLEFIWKSHLEVCNL